mmetsp:Transcript_11360/g.19405  ORF Transcript_11360/g.19405 Transcript_11360/m.19405 type:complete len:415 (+) Transcript_11360:132-1376(+)|eukprot:CAMPEP_0198211558 /NCGR_PEP_ID=MMETSP1445-20131203/24466_1 /TAXON_ID=36898 /ORGANISM="Pyramimonas sp., Strain CCMP2087" /LENGTH=414 /DNA_ID=CAMNT_0043885833 /DNA_START=129 /DNA_END=1373 /DNA_ORIENTATION=+
MVLAIQGALGLSSTCQRGHTPVHTTGLFSKTAPGHSFRIYASGKVAVIRSATAWSHKNKRWYRSEKAHVRMKATSAVADTTAGTWEATTGEALLQGKREDMEDYTCVKRYEDYVYGGVFDGHGGGSAAKYLSENLADRLADRIKKGGTTKSLEATLSELFEDFDEELMDYLEDKGGKEWQCGSTATVALVFQDKALVANVGDSRAVLGKKNGKAVDLSSEHRPYGKNEVSLREMSRIADAGGWVDDGRVLGILAVSRAFGDLEFKRGLAQLLVDGVIEKMWTKAFAKSVDFKANPVVATPDVEMVTLGEDDDFMIVASDGLWEVTTSAQAVTFVKRALAKEGMSEKSLQKVTKDLVEDAVKRRRSSDNVSCVIFALPGSVVSSSAAAPSGNTAASKPKAAPKSNNPFASLFKKR